MNLGNIDKYFKQMEEDYTDTLDFEEIEVIFPVGDNNFTFWDKLTDIEKCELNETLEIYENEISDFEKIIRQLRQEYISLRKSFVKDKNIININ